MMTLPAELDRCLHRHTRYILASMQPDGVFVYLSGAKVTDKDDREQFSWAHDDYGKNHALLSIVARHGVKGFEAFLEALETTRQSEIAERLKSTLEEEEKEGGTNDGYGRVTSNAGRISKIKNVGESHLGGNSKSDSAGPLTGGGGGGAASSSSASTPVYIVRPRAASSSPERPTRLTRARATPLTPPLTEDELDDHLARLKTLLTTISTTHGDRYCRHEAKSLLGDLDEAGEAMMIRLKQLSEENQEKEKELRRAKYMVRGLETEIQRLSTSSTTSSTTTGTARTTPPDPTTTTTTTTAATSRSSPGDSVEEENGSKRSGSSKKSKTCAIL